MTDLVSFEKIPPFGWYFLENGLLSGLVEIGFFGGVDNVKSGVILGDFLSILPGSGHFFCIFFVDKLVLILAWVWLKVGG